jgi:CheY-like chemotaxis protein
LLEPAGDIVVVAEAGDGVDGAVIRRQRPDVVLLDVRTPKASGLDLLRDLRHTNELPPTIPLALRLVRTLKTPTALPVTTTSSRRTESL